MNIPKAKDMRAKAQELTKASPPDSSEQVVNYLIHSVESATYNGQKQTYAQLPAFISNSEVLKLKAMFRKQGYRISIETKKGEIGQAFFRPAVTTLRIGW